MRVSRVASQPQSVTTLGVVVETVRRVMRADTASVAAFSLAERTITWKALTGFHTRGPNEPEFVAPLRGDVAGRAATAQELIIFERVGESDGIPATEFPLHSAEGVRTVALAPLRARGETLGALVVGFRSAHEFTSDERETLEGLAATAALALDNARLLETVSAAKKIWEQTFDAIPDGIIVHDSAMTLTRANATAAEMMGYDSPAEAIGLSCSTAFARLFGERAAAYHMTKRAGAASSFEIQAEDSRRYLVAIAPLDAVDGTSGSSVITWSDVTQLSEMQEQLARTRRLATVGQLAAGVAHEINNPLAAITTCAEATLRDIRSDPTLALAAEERNWSFYLEEIVRQALRCKLITRGLLDLARQRRASRESCDLNSLASHALRLFEQRAAAREGHAPVAFTLDADESIGEVATDESLVRQVLDNLLTNALDALGERGGAINIKTLTQGERVCIEVADTGDGIAPETLARIFEPFFSTKETGKGSGLGLAVATTLAEALGGALTVESKLGAGSRFRLWLPRRAAEERVGV
ncbi:MAG: two-component system, NtrC family, sensor kinase [Acidobacteriota bacterium]|nr:two-component system, NtrC family, sensor kinase [Acidobacteriota bacterium]